MVFQIGLIRNISYSKSFQANGKPGWVIDFVSELSQASPAQSCWAWPPEDVFPIRQMNRPSVSKNMEWKQMLLFCKI